MTLYSMPSSHGHATALTGLDRRPLTMAHQIANAIGQAIFDDEYGPGDRIREQDLAATFNVSRGPIREALRIVESRGLVKIIPQRGARVTQLSAREVDDLFQIRSVLLTLLAANLHSVDPTLIGALEQRVSELERCSKDPEAWREYVEASIRISHLLTAAASNRRLAEMIDSLGEQTARYTKLGLRDPQRRVESALGWRTFLTQLSAGNPVAASETVRSLVDATRTTSITALD
jgi:DNA-binding GntR family transcriptional regulator